MEDKIKATIWLKSKDVMKSFKIRACHHTHLRIKGALQAKKERNCFLYVNSECEKYFLKKRLHNVNS